MMKKYLSLLLMVLLLCSAFPISGSISSTEALVSEQATELEPTIAQDYFDDPDHILPVSILVYTEYADTSIGAFGEFANTMGAIDNTYGLDYYYENLTDYTQLPSVLPGHDILLIPEQEGASPQNMTDVGTAWDTTLVSFVNGGGIVILMDYGPPVSRGVTSHIYSASNLMEINGFHQITGTQVYRVNDTDALARGVDSTFTSPSGSLGFETPETTAVVDNGTLPMVVHKIMGKGHVVLLGFDFFIVEDNSAQILANAIRLHRHVVFDDSHSSMDDMNGEFSNFTDDLVADGFAVSSMGQFSAEYLSGCDVLVMTTSTAAYTTAEIDVIEQFVQDGGGLFIATEVSIWGDDLDPVIERFGYMRNKTHYLNDTDDVVPGGTHFQFALQSDNILNHSTTLRVDNIYLYGTCGFTQIPSEATSLLFTDSDGTTTFDDWGSTTDYQTPAIGTPVAASSLYGDGRIIVFGDTSVLLGQNDADSSGISNYFEMQNDDFLQNSMRWLGAAGTPERIVVFDESHGAQFTLGISFQKFGDHLTSNGYTVKKMTTFYTTLLDQADILVMVDSTTNHSTAERNAIQAFVATGGSLLLLGAYEDARNTVDVLGNQFGIDINNTGYLTDSDDAVVSDNYIAYDQSNFAAHPITEGISRFEDYFSTAFNTIGSATSLLATDDDGTCQWSNGGQADGLSMMVALEHQAGRMVYTSGYVFLAHNQDTDSDGQVNFYDSDNDLLVTNIFKWLSEDRGAILDILSPNGGETLTGDDVPIVWDALDPNDDPITINLYYSSNAGGDWTPITTGLSDDHYTWSITGVPDSEHYLVRIEALSTTFSVMDESDTVFTIDHNPPEWTDTPTDQIIIQGARLAVQFGASDVSGIDAWWIDDTEHFAISGSGYLTDNMVLDVGVYDLTISVNDTLGRVQSIDITITVLEAGLDAMMIIIIVVGAAAAIIIIVIVYKKKGS
ncbi:MAG: hypothetical protein ACXADC_12470 [Candidatus Thorarchaeota archaeon]|jgi:hypothetical protein